MSRQTIKSMSTQCVDAKPIDFDWSTGYGGYDESGKSWEYTCAARCEECGKIVAGADETGDKHSDLVDGTECQGYVSGGAPMMNYYYPLDENARRFDQNEAARKLVDLPVCIVEIDGDEIGLALTGGGMDLAWEICEAHMLLGMLPPAHFALLPEICGRGTSAKDRWIIAGCRASLIVMRNRANWNLNMLRGRYAQSADSK